jgi:hypothetical protein
VSKKEKPTVGPRDRPSDEAEEVGKREPADGAESLDAAALRDGSLAAQQRMALRTSARGEPAPLDQSEVDQLIHGETDRGLVERLASTPVVPDTRPEGAAAASFAPVRIAEEDLERLISSGETPKSLNARLEAAAKTPGRFGDADTATSAKAAPKLPPEET